MTTITSMRPFYTTLPVGSRSRLRSYMVHIAMQMNHECISFISKTDDVFLRCRHLLECSLSSSFTCRALSHSSLIVEGLWQPRGISHTIYKLMVMYSLLSIVNSVRCHNKLEAMGYMPEHCWGSGCVMIMLCSHNVIHDAMNFLIKFLAVSYTHLTLPTIYSV